MYEKLVFEIEDDIFNSLNDDENTIDRLMFQLKKVDESINYNDTIKNLILKINDYYLLKKTPKSNKNSFLTGLISLLSYNIPYKDLTTKTMAYLGEYTSYMSREELEDFLEKILNNYSVLNTLSAKIDDNYLISHLLTIYDDYNELEEDLKNKSLEELIRKTAYKTYPEGGGISI